jgi:DNA-binding IclR family transcriptional regulator
MASLARGVERDLRSAALPELTFAANDLTMTTFLVVLDQTECVTLLSVEPRAGAATLAQRPGTRHSLSVGAPGLALQSVLSDRELAERGGVKRRTDDGAVGDRGYAVSHDEVIVGLRSIAVPIVVPGSLPASITAVCVSSSASEQIIGRRLLIARDAILATAL